MATEIKRPVSNLLTRDNFEIYGAKVKAEDKGYKAGDILTYDGDEYSLASLANDDDHTESYAVVFEDIPANATIGAVVEFGGVRESLLSQAYQDLSDDDKKIVRKELNAKKIFIDNI